jgi:ABC-type amino acid transport substrate-binding protein
MTDRGALCLVDRHGTGTWLHPRDGAFDGVRDLDSARLEHALAATPHEVSYQHGVAEVLRALASGQAEAGILIRPVSLAEIRRTANEGLLMPPKSTFFTPKLRTGLVLRPL